MASLSTLPRDILLDNIIPFLSVRDFLSLSRTCRALHAYSTDEVYWRKLISSTFRFPAQPIRNEGWRDLYRNMTKARVFTWGLNKNGRLGHSYRDADVRNISNAVSTPKEIPGLEREIVVDIKAGGWSTTVLTASGAVFSCGSLSDQFPVATSTTKLKFPRGRSTKIAEVSSGRSHILALSEKGEIWLWQRIQNVGQFVKFIHIDTKLYRTDYYDTDRPKGTVQRIVAGWDNTSAALVIGVGIVVWWISELYDRQNSDGMLVDGEVVPGTQFTTYGSDNLGVTDALASSIGEVVDMIGGEGFLVFLTKSGGVWAIKTSGPGSVAGTSPIQLFEFSAPAGSEPMAHISGSFRTFAVFNKAGLVYLGSKETVMAAFELGKNLDYGRYKDPRLLPEILPSLQNKQIVAIAFGDYHYLALTSSGKIFSWGTESMTCGCLGLGPKEIAKRRGVDYIGPNGRLKEPQAVYFTRQQQISAASLGSCSDSIESDFFVFNIAAAGWHSGALVLVPPSYEREQEKQPQRSGAESEEVPRYPRQMVRPHYVPHHFNRPVGEAGHGGRLQDAPADDQSEEVLPTSHPFISLQPAERAIPGPAVTGRTDSELNTQQTENPSDQIRNESETHESDGTPSSGGSCEIV